jgi:DNA-binding transcriptional MerR regulator
VIAVVRRLAGVSLPLPTIDRWIRAGLITPSVRRARGSGVSHLWSAEDALVLAFLARIRGERMSVYRYRDALRSLRKQLPTLLGQSGELYFVALGNDVTVLRTEALGELLERPASQTFVVCKVAAPVEVVRTELDRIRQQTRQESA